MGGCFSTSTKEQESLSKAKPAATIPRYPVTERDPRPPEPDAEETVKEVLSETPRLRPRPTPLPTTRTRADPEANSKEVDIIDKGLATGIPLPGIVCLPTDSSNGCDARSEDASEAWSVSAKSETLSASTTTTPAEKRRGAAVEAGRRAAREERSPAKYQRKRSVSGDFACRRDRSVAVGCGSGRSSPSPAARRSEHAAVGRTNSAREAARSRAAGVGVTRDPGERSGRRSVSPAVKRAAELRQNGGHCRVPAATVAATRANGTGQQITADEEGRRLCVQNEGVAGGGAAGSEGEAAESLENPLVSLECFIFL